MIRKEFQEEFFSKIKEKSCQKWSKKGETREKPMDKKELINRKKEKSGKSFIVL